MSHSKLLTDAIGSALKPAGFKRKAGNWRLRNSDTIHVLNLQKSQYGDQYIM